MRAAYERVLRTSSQKTDSDDNVLTTFIIKSDVVPALRAGAAALFSYEGGYSAVFVWCFLFLMFFCCGFRTVRFGARAVGGFAPIFPDICYHLTHYKPAAADIPVASDNPAHYADAIRYNARTPLQGSLLPLTRLVWA